MTTLPASTEPWNEKIERLHSPKAAKRQGGYEDYRCCLRWEFDFTCAFCLCHEADLRRGVDEGTKGTGTFSIEHFVPKEREPLLANEYSNCFYACRYCNRDRGRKPNRDAAGRRLLNPCADVWSDFFVRNGDCLEPRSNRPDAEYTHEVYKLDLPAKIRARTLRRKKILDYQRALHEYPALIDELRRAGLDRGDSTLIRAAALLREKRRDTIRDISERLTIIPRDAESPCPCRRVALWESGARLELAQRAAGIVTWEWNLVTDELIIPAHAAEILGCSPSQLWATGREILAAMHPDDQETFAEALRLCLESGRDFSAEIRLQAPDGSYRWFHDHGRSVCDESGVPMRVIGMIRDISDRRQGEERLRQSAEP